MSPHLAVPVDPRYAGRARAWLDSVARLTYAQRCGAARTEVDELADDVAEQQVLLLRLMADPVSAQRTCQEP